MDPATILGGIKILGGLFQKKKKAPTPRDNIMSQAAGVMEASAAYGIHPLTMLQYGNPGGAGGGGSDMGIGSLDYILDGAADIADVVSGDRDRRRAAEEANLELAQIKIDQARSGVYVAGMPGALSPSTSITPTIAGVAPSQPGMPADPSSDMTLGGTLLTNDRNTVPKDNVNTSGVFEVDNKATGGPIALPGDTEPWGIDELLTAVVVGAPQAAWNWGGNLGQKWADNHNDIKRRAAAGEFDDERRKHEDTYTMKPFPWMDDRALPKLRKY